MVFLCFVFVFFFNDTATTVIYTLSLHDALPISYSRTAVENYVGMSRVGAPVRLILGPWIHGNRWETFADRKSTRLNSSHSQISYAVFCLKKKNNIHHTLHNQPISNTIMTTSLDK